LSGKTYTVSEASNCVSSGTLKTAQSFIQSMCSFLQLACDFYAVREVLFVGILNVDFAFICHHCH